MAVRAARPPPAPARRGAAGGGRCPAPPAGSIRGQGCGSGRVIVESGQTCDFKCADDFFGLLVASQGRSHSKLRLIRSYKIPEMCQLRARAKRACNRRRESRCSRVQQHLAHDLRR